MRSNTNDRTTIHSVICQSYQYERHQVQQL